MNYSNINKNVFWGVLGKGVSFLKNIITFPLIIGVLGAENFGVYQTLLSIFGLISFLSVGVNPNVTFVISRNATNDERCNAVHSALRFLFLIFFVLTAIYFGVNGQSYVGDIVGAGVDHSLIDLCFLLTFLSLIFSLGDSVRAGLQQHYILTSIANWVNIAQMIAVLVCIYLVEMFNGWIYIAVSLGFVCVAKGVNFCYVLRGYELANRWLFPIAWKYYRSLFKVGGSFFLMQVAIYMGMNGVVIYAANRMGAASVTLYQVNAIFYTSFIAIVGLYTTPLATGLHNLRYSGADSKKFSRVFLKSFACVVVLSFLASLFVYFCGIEIVELWMGKEYVMETKGYLYSAVFIFNTGFIYVIGAAYGAREKFGLMAALAVLQSSLLFLMLFVWEVDSVESLIKMQAVSSSVLVLIYAAFFKWLVEDK